MATQTLIGRRSLLFAVGTACSRATGFLRDLVMAAAFGSDPAVASFLLAFRLANLPRRLLGEGAMHAAFVPTYEAHSRPNEALRFMRDLALLVSGAALVFVFLGVGIALLIGGETAHLAVLLLPLIVFIALYGLCSAFLNCNENFLLPGAAPALLNLGWTAAALLLRDLAPAQAMPPLAVAIVLACAIQAGVVLWPALRKLRPVLLAPLQLGRTGRAIWKPLSLSLLGVGATQINSALDGLFARFADPSGPAYLWYAIRLQQLPFALVGMALFAALLPALSRAAKSGDDTEFRCQLSYGVRRSGLWLLPTSLGMTLFAPEIVHQVYAHGAFGSASVFATASALRGYSVGLWPMALVLIFSGGLQAQKAYWRVGLISLATVALNVGLNSLFVLVLRRGPASVALATSISCLAQTGVLVASLYAPRSRRSNAG